MKLLIALVGGLLLAQQGAVEVVPLSPDDREKMTKSLVNLLNLKERYRQLGEQITSAETDWSKVYNETRVKYKVADNCNFLLVDRSFTCPASAKEEKKK